MLILDLSEYPGKYDGWLPGTAKGSWPSSDFFFYDEGFLIPRAVCGRQKQARHVEWIE